MNFEFAKYTEVSEFAKREFAEQYESYSRLFICPDVWDFHFIRVMPGMGEDYVPNERAILVEYEKFPMDLKGEKLTISKLRRLLFEDDLSNWDYHVLYSMEDVIESIDQGFGILNLSETIEP